MGPLAGILEAAFLEWAAQQQKAREARGVYLNPNFDHPLQFYDSRRLFLAGPEHWPNEAGDWHGESRYKLQGHPNRFVEGEDTLRGGPATKAAIRANKRRHKKVAKRFGEYNKDED